MKIAEKKALLEAMGKRKKFAERKYNLWETRWGKYFDARMDEPSAKELDAAEQMEYWKGVKAGLEMAMECITEEEKRKEFGGGTDAESD